MAEVTGDDVIDVFAAGEDETEHLHTNETERSFSISNIDHIRNILTKESITVTEDVGVTGDVGVFDEEDIQEIPPSSPDMHPDPSTDGIYTRLKRNIKLT